MSHGSVEGRYAKPRVTDTDLRDRTVDQALATPGNTGPLTSILSWLAGRIKATSGTTNWYDAPAASIATIWGKFDSSTGHAHDGTANNGKSLGIREIWPRSQDIDNGATEDFRFNIKAAPAATAVTLVVEGRLPRGAQLSSHTHRLEAVNEPGEHVDLSTTSSTMQSGHIESTGTGGYTTPQRPSGVTVTIDGVDRTAALGGALGTAGSNWNSSDLNITSFVVGTGWHTIVFGNTNGGKLNVIVIVTY